MNELQLSFSVALCGYHDFLLIIANVLSMNEALKSLQYIISLPGDSFFERFALVIETQTEMDLIRF